MAGQSGRVDDKSGLQELRKVFTVPRSKIPTGCPDK